MASENVEIKISEAGSGTRELITNVNQAATAVDRLADSEEKSVGASKNAAAAREAEAASTAKAATAVKGYIDGQGNYIRNVGSQANAVKSAGAAQSELTSRLSANSIEVGRAAAGYGPLNSGITAAQAAAAAARANVQALTTGLAGGATAAQAAGVGLGQVGAAGNAAAVGIGNGRNAFQGVGSAASGATAPVNALGSAIGAVGRGGGSGLSPVTSGIAGVGSAASTAAAPVGRLGAALQATGQAAVGLAGTLAGVGLAVGAAQVVKVADSYTQVQNKLRLVTTDQAKLNDIMNQAFDIAQKTQTPFNSIANIFGRLALASSKYGLTMKDAATVTDSLGLAFKISGSSADEAQRALAQFTQGLQKGKLEAQDFKIMLETTPAIEGAMVAGLQRIGVTVNGSLTTALSTGTVTAKQMLQALVAINPVLNTFAQGALPTVSGAMTNVSNAFERYIGQANSGGTITGTLVSALMGLANNMNTVIPIALGLGAVLAFGAVAAAVVQIAALGAAFVGLLTAIGPVGIALAAVGAAVAIPLWQKYGDSIRSMLPSLGGIVSGSTSAATATRQVGAAAANAAAGFSRAGEAIRTGANDFKTVGGAAVATGVELRSLSNTAGSLGTVWNSMTAGAEPAANAFRNVGTSAAAGGAGFTEISGKAGTAAGAFGQVGTAATSAAAPILQAGSAAQQAAQAQSELAAKTGAVAPSASNVGSALEALRNSYVGLQNDVAPNIQTLAQFDAATNQVSASTAAKAANDNGAAAASAQHTTAITSASAAASANNNSMGALASTLARVRGVISSVGSAWAGLTSIFGSTTSATTAATGATNELTSATNNNSGAATANAGATAQMEAARNTLTTTTQNAAASQSSFAERLRAVSGEFNGLGEKLMTNEQFMQKSIAAQNAYDAAITQSLANLRSWGEVQDANNAKIGTGNANIGQFTEAQIQANAALSQGKSAAEGLSSSLGSVASAYQSAGSGAEFFAIHSKAANTVSGMLGGDNYMGPLNFNADFIPLGPDDERSNAGATKARDRYIRLSAEKQAKDQLITDMVGRAYRKNPTLNDFGADGKPKSSSMGGYATGGTFVVGSHTTNDNVRNVEHFATGGTFKVGGSGGTDSQEVRFMASPNERVTVTTPGQNMRGGPGMGDTGQAAIVSAIRQGFAAGGRMPTTNIQIKADDYDQYRRSQRQIAQDISGRVARSRVAG